MKFLADLHIHSRFSRATARNLDFENLYIWAHIKGLQVVATGDFSHPGWFSEIECKLEPAEGGLLRLREEFIPTLDARIPQSCDGMVRFVLVTEISNIYKKDGRTRKNHNLVFSPTMEVAKKLNRKLQAIGNIESDGRPILGLDARDLLELVLETSTDAFLIPAHIWTPWFSMLGSKSGFDSIDECFGDLARFVFAAETGLSSDPGMNWRVSSLDRVTLISNSDAHSPANLGREANIFDTDLSYFAMRDALRRDNSHGFLGTIEFFPEEGKYHLDGHRACGVRLDPRETMTRQGICPLCGKPLTIGVLYRVEELADQPEGRKPERAPAYRNLIPLTDILSEILQVGPKTSRVSQAYRTAIESLGPEFVILQDLAPDSIEKAGIPLLAEAVRRMRAGKIDIRPGFDGEYGKIKIFDPQERIRIEGQRSLFGHASSPGANVRADRCTGSDATSKRQDSGEGWLSKAKAPCGAVAGAGRPDRPPDITPAAPRDLGSRLNAEQRRVVESQAQSILVLAGPGTGKTHTLTCRIANLILNRGISPQTILAVTFTNKAAEEMRSRLGALLGSEGGLPHVMTLHGFCLTLLRELNPDQAFSIINEDEQGELIAHAAAQFTSSGTQEALRVDILRRGIMRAKQNLRSPDDACQQDSESPAGEVFFAVYRAYQQLLEIQHLYDYEDLIYRVVTLLESDPEFCRACRQRFRLVFVDEYQDLNHGQYRLIRALMPEESGGRHLCVIGDPDQSIYGFRGSDCLYFNRFVKDYPGAEVIHLNRNYRSSRTVLAASYQVISRNRSERVPTYSTIDGFEIVRMLGLPDEHREAQAIARIIEEMTGGSGYHSIDSRRIKTDYPSQAMSYSDFAVLTRTHDQLRVISDHFKEAGIPFQAVSRRQSCAEHGISRLLALLKIVAGCGSYGDLDQAVGLLGAAIEKKTISVFKEWCLANRVSLKDGLTRCRRFPIRGLRSSQQSRLTGLADGISVIRDAVAGLDAGQQLLYLSRMPKIAPETVSPASQEALNRIMSMAASGMNVACFLEQFALRGDADFYHPRAEKVAVMTLHAAKGLEFPVVFVSGCEDDLIPFRRLDGDAADIEEERRLFYVAMTRAGNHLIFTYAKRRRIFGKTRNRRISPFVKDIEERLMRSETVAGRLKEQKPDQLRLF